MNHQGDIPFQDDSKLVSAGLTDRGQVREKNQDQYLIAQLKKSMLVDSTSLDFEQHVFGDLQSEILLVADGMGGHAAGEKASQLAIQYLVRRLLNSIHWFSQHEEDAQRESAFVNDLRDLLRDAHQRILRESAQHFDRRGMGTTLTMAHLVGSRMYVVHAGDSRCYLVRDGKAEQITTDHTLAHQMVEAGGMKPEDEAESQWSNVLWNVLGGNSESDIIAEVHRVDLREGDAVVLCSDGLYRYVDSATLAAVVHRSDSPAEACRELISIANGKGGEDNITVVIARPSVAGLRTTWVDDFGTVIPD